MKNIILSIILALTAFTANAQTAVTTTQQAAPILRYGYMSCDSVLHHLPAYTAAMKNLSDLKAKYDSEMKRVEDEFNQKYELFLEGQRDFAPSILQKRQAELQELMEKNAAFKKEAQRLLKKAEDESLAPIRKTIKAAATRIGQQQGLAFILNTDNDAVPYTDTTMGIDITNEVIRAAR